MATFRLRHRHSYDPLSITHCLSLKAPRLTRPPQWHWSWPLHSSSTFTSPANSTASPTALDASSSFSSSSSVRHIWVSAIRAVSVSDDAQFVAFLSQHGAIALSRPSSDHSTITLSASPHDFEHPQFEIWCQVATSLTFFHLQFPDSLSSSSASALPSATPSRLILAVGYATGAVAFFDPVNVRLLSVSKLPTTDPIRHLRFYPISSSTNSDARPEEHLSTLRNQTGLLAVAGWSGLVAQFPCDELIQLLDRQTHQPMPAIDPNAAGWLIWNLSSQDAILDAVICGTATVSSYETPHDENSNEEQFQSLRIATVGVNAPIVAYHASPQPPFSARAAAARVATSFMSAAKGFLLSRLTTQVSSENENGDDQIENERAAVKGAARGVAAWVDDPDAYASSSFKIGDGRTVVRRALETSFQAGLQQRTKHGSVTKTLANSTRTATETGTTRSSSAPYSTISPTGKTISSVRAAAAAKISLSARSITGRRRGYPSIVTDADVVKRVHSMTAREDVAGLLARHTKNTNMRIVERVAFAPNGCGLLACCDTLGRIFIQDSSDFCVLRILKGYRDASIAWIGGSGSSSGVGKTLLAVHAPRLDVVELHGPLEQRRREAFKVLPGTLLVQSTSNNVFCVFPDGRVFELSAVESGRSNNADDVSGASEVDSDGKGSVEIGTQSQKGQQLHQTSFQNEKAGVLPTLQTGHEKEENIPDYELTGQFLEAVKSGRASRAVECMDRVANDAFKITYLMATLVTTTSQVRVDVHMALASKAGHLVAQLQNPDLVCRFEAHRRLAEAFQLIEAEPTLLDCSVDRLRGSSKLGPRLIEDELGYGLVGLGMNELKNGPHLKSSAATSTKPESGKRMIKGRDGLDPFDDDEIEEGELELGMDRGMIAGVNCETFILSHCLVPTVDLEVEAEFEILPRSDLSQSEQVWLSMAYFGKVLELDLSVNVPVINREHPATAEIFAALAHYVGLSEAEITKQFVTFFLHAPLIPLLNTYVSLHASSLQCTIARIRSLFTRDVVDRIVLDACETTSRVANAVLLVRLCATHGEDYGDGGDDDDVGGSYDIVANDGGNVDKRNTDGVSVRHSLNPYVDTLDRLNEALIFQKLIIGSAVPKMVQEEFTAMRFSGARGNGELMAVVELLKANEFERVVNIFEGRVSGMRRLVDLSSKESAVLSAAALESCRKKTAQLINNPVMQQVRVIPVNVESWIRLVEGGENSDGANGVGDKLRLQRLGEIRAVLIAAHTYIPDSSVDAVRSLQLAEAISALIDVEERKIIEDSMKGQGEIGDDDDDDSDFEDAKDIDEILH